MSEPTTHEVSKDLARLRERMNTHQAKYEGALDRFRADMDSFRADMSKNESAFERLRTDMANKDTAFERLRTDMANKDTAFERFRTDMANKDTASERLRTDIEKFCADMAQRESNRMQWLIGIWIGGVLVTIAVLGILIRLAI